MKREFIDTESLIVAQAVIPWANVYLKVTNGFLCFESPIDANNWLAWNITEEEQRT